MPGTRHSVAGGQTVGLLAFLLRDGVSMKRGISKDLFKSFLLSCVLFCVGACGTSVLPPDAPGNNKGNPPPGGGNPAPVGTTVKADTAFDRTGTLRSDGLFLSMVGSNFVIAGDEGDTNLGQRAIMSVVLNQVPAGANVTKAVLKVRRFISEGNPFGKFGAMTVDHINAVSSISAGNFLGGTLTQSIATINPPAGVNSNANLELDVTAQVKADLAAGRPISSFRFQFNNGPSLDGTFDQVFFFAEQNDETMRPTVTVTIAP